MDTLLAIDTALNACSVAITHGETTLVSRVEPMARGQAERLAPMVAELMAQAGVSFGQIDRLGVTRGPGAFTGVRIGLAFARGLALSLDRPCIGFSTLEVLAAGAGRQKSLAAISVAGSHFYGAWAGGQEIVAPCRADLDQVLDTLEGDWAVTGPGAASVLTRRPMWRHIAQDVPDPVILATLARHADPATHAPHPLYLRGVEAKLPGGLTLPDAVA
jgi:tRNA threonylcarbamoyladenosine biosynthesis protein TsaB